MVRRTFERRFLAAQRGRNPAQCLLILGWALLLLAGCRHSASSDADADPQAGTARFHCPMHPTYTSEQMGDCPICNMKLVPIREGVGRDDPAAASVAGRALIMVSPEKQHLIGLRTATVFPRLLTETVHAPGVVEHDETALARIAPRFSGWVRKLHVNYTGQPVERGHPLLSVYSPEVMASENDYLLAWRRWQQVQGEPETSAREAARQLWQAARRRLELWEIRPDEIRAVEARGEAADEILLRAPVSGHVISKSAVEGAAFTAGATLYELGTLDPLWVRATVPEAELVRVEVGQAASVTVPALGGRTIETRVSFVYPHLDPWTRRGSVRLVVANPDHQLRPDMWVRVEIMSDLGERLTVPASAVIDTGARQLAFVRREDHHLEPREVEVGVRTADWWEILAGLEEGEKVVTRALFLIDSESQLRAAVSGH